MQHPALTSCRERAETDASLFAVPADFKMVDGPQRVIYRPKQ